jgi:hypothetical protein
LLGALTLEYTQEEAETYLLALAIRSDAEIDEAGRSAAYARLRRRGEAAWLVDAMTLPATART